MFSFSKTEEDWITGRELKEKGKLLINCMEEMESGGVGMRDINELRHNLGSMSKRDYPTETDLESRVECGSSL